MRNLDSNPMTGAHHGPGRRSRVGAYAWPANLTAQAAGQGQCLLGILTRLSAEESINANFLKLARQLTA